MCTLTYRLTESGYELFFNRDEQRQRVQAVPPQFHQTLNAIYPIDPLGKGTWIAVHKNGLSLALLNYYQAEKKAKAGEFNSRGEIILTLLAQPEHPVEALKKLPLSCYQPFQLCIFESGLTLSDKKLCCFVWNGEQLNEVPQTLPITSSGVDFPLVYKARSAMFAQMVDEHKPTTLQLNNYHQSQQSEGKLSVKMSREDAQTVSFTHISVSDEVKFAYTDHLDKHQYLIAL